MKTTKRFENAVTKLYTAFHEGTLNAGNCEHCAVGNICDNNYEWADFTGWSSKLGVLRVGGSKAYEAIKNTGYSPSEIVRIEYVFLKAQGINGYMDIKDENAINKEYQFKGLCAVVKYLCELDDIPNVMEVQSLFEYEGEKKQLTEVFI